MLNLRERRARSAGAQPAYDEAGLDEELGAGAGAFELSDPEIRW